MAWWWVVGNIFGLWCFSVFNGIDGRFRYVWLLLSYLRLVSRYRSFPGINTGRVDLFFVESALLLLDMFLITTGGLFYLFPRSIAGHLMYIVVFVGDGDITLEAGFSSGFAFLEVGGVLIDGYVEVAVFTVFRFLVAVVGVCFEVVGGEGAGAVGAGFLFVILLIMFVFEVDIVEFVADGALFNIAAAVAEMSCDFALRELFEAVVASLERLFLHP